MEDIIKLLLHDYEKVEELSDKELRKLISEILDIEEVPSALHELHRRDTEQAMILGKNILESNKGDVYLQAAVIDFIFEYDKKYIFDFTMENIITMHWYVYGCLLDCFSVESKQTFGKQLSYFFIGTVLNRYKCYGEKERSKIKDNYMWFLNSYSEMINDENL